MSTAVYEAETPTEVRTLRPAGDRIIVHFIESLDEERTSGGIVMPDSAKTKPMFARVLAVGPGAFLRYDDDPDKPEIRAPMSCYEGDTICLNQYAGCPVEMGEDTVQIIRDEDVMAVINE